MKNMLAAKHKTVWMVGAIVLFALCLMPVGWGLGAQAWVDELQETLSLYRAMYPEGNWDPYLEKLLIVKVGIAQANQHLINTAMDDFLMMLRSQAHGINGVAAHALYWIALGLQPVTPSMATFNRLSTACRQRSCRALPAY